MKITKRSLVPVVAVAIIALGAGTLVINNQHTEKSNIAYAYTSAVNAQSPETAPDSYVVNFPDANFKAALNEAIATKTSTTRTATQNITYGEMKTLTGIIPQSTFAGKDIRNIEGAQFLQNATIIYFNGIPNPANQNQNRIRDVSPLSALTKVKRLYLRSNQITNISSLASLTNLERIDLYGNLQLSNISALENMDKLVEVNVGSTPVNNLAPLANKNQLEYLHIDGLQNGKPDLTPILNLPKLWSINAGHNRFSQEELSVLKDMPALRQINVSGNTIYNLQSLLSNGGFRSLVGNGSTFIDQKHTIQTTHSIIPNPIRGISGEIVPITETATVKNANADGTLNPNGEYIKLMNHSDAGSATVSWTKNFTYGSFVTEKTFGGSLTIEYDLETVAPTFSPENPTKIISRKGIAININDITAEDNAGGSGIHRDGISNNATVISLDDSNPEAGNYTLSYTVSDNNGNVATIEREIEITDADALQSELNDFDESAFNDKTAESVNRVKAAIANARSIIANNQSSQADIDAAVANLQAAILGLQAIPVTPTVPTPATPETTEQKTLKAPNSGLKNNSENLALTIIAALNSLALIIFKSKK